MSNASAAKTNKGKDKDPVVWPTASPAASSGDFHVPFAHKVDAWTRRFQLASSGTFSLARRDLCNAEGHLDLDALQAFAAALASDTTLKILDLAPFGGKRPAFSSELQPKTMSETKRKVTDPVVGAFSSSSTPQKATTGFFTGLGAGVMGNWGTTSPPSPPATDSSASGASQPEFSFGPLPLQPPQFGPSGPVKKAFLVNEEKGEARIVTTAPTTPNSASSWFTGQQPPKFSFAPLSQPSQGGPSGAAKLPVTEIDGAKPVVFGASTVPTIAAIPNLAARDFGGFGSSAAGTTRNPASLTEQQPPKFSFAPLSQPPQGGPFGTAKLPATEIDAARPVVFGASTTPTSAAIPNLAARDFGGGFGASAAPTTPNSASSWFTGQQPPKFSFGPLSQPSQGGPSGIPKLPATAIDAAKPVVFGASTVATTGATPNLGAPVLGAAKPAFGTASKNAAGDIGAGYFTLGGSAAPTIDRAISAAKLNVSLPAPNVPAGAFVFGASATRKPEQTSNDVFVSKPVMSADTPLALQSTVLDSKEVAILTTALKQNKTLIIVYLQRAVVSSEIWRAFCDVGFVEEFPYDRDEFPVAMLQRKTESTTSMMTKPFVDFKAKMQQLMKDRQSILDYRGLDNLEPWRALIDSLRTVNDRLVSEARLLKTKYAGCLHVTEIDRRTQSYETALASIKSVPSWTSSELEMLIARRNEARQNLIAKITEVLPKFHLVESESSDSYDVVANWVGAAEPALQRLCEAENITRPGAQDNGDLIAQAKNVLRDVEAWRTAFSPANFFTRTDEAYERFLARLTDYLGATNGSSTIDDDFQAASDAFGTAVAAEMAFINGFQPYIYAPLGKVVSVVSELLDAAHEALDIVDRQRTLENDLAGRLSVLQFAECKPTTDKLEALVVDMKKLGDEIDDLKRDVSKAERWGESSVQHLKQNLAQANQRANKLSRKIADEKVRLYRVANQFYPELLLAGSPFTKHVGVDSLAVDAVAQAHGLVLDNVTIDNFTVLESINPRVLKVVDASDKLGVLKSFSLGHEQHARHFYRQVALIAGLQDPHLAPITGVFREGNHRAWIWMPFFAGGDLAAWMAANPAPQRDVSLCRQFLADILRGVKVLHDRGLVHGDIKPGNVFLTAGKRAVLGDFDGIRNMDGTATLVGTVGFLAPEIRNGHSKQLTPATDIFSVGRIAEELFKGTSMPETEWRVHVDSMLSEDPETRPLAAACLAMPLAKQAVVADVARCCVCLEPAERHKGLKCGEGHFMCTSCLDGYLASIVQPDSQPALLAQYGGDLPCCVPECASPVFSLKEVAAVSGREAFTAYMDGVKRLVEQRTSNQLEADLRRRMDEFERAGIQNYIVKKHVDHILDEILTLRCPSCRRPFADFGRGECFALKCPCKIQFCGYCLANCGADAHRHVRNCPHNPYPGSLFHPDDVRGFETVQKQRRARLVREYWARDIAALEPAQRQEILQRLRTILQDYGVAVNDLN